MPARSTSTRTIRGAAIGALALTSVFLLQVPAAAQDRSLVPTEVKVVAGDASSANVSWVGVRAEGVTYRVLRMGEGDKAPMDITRPVRVTSVVDPKVAAGLTYLYQVMAVFLDGTTTSTDPVKFTAPSAPAPAPLTIVTQMPYQTATAVPLFATAVTGVTVTGNTTAAALVSWQPAGMATSYSVKRTSSTGYTVITPPGLTTTSWNDTGPGGGGFMKAGVYAYEVTATLSNGSTVSGQASWTRPDPSCAEPPAGQSLLTVLTPTQITLPPSYPGIALLHWQSVSQAIAYRVDRSLQGSGTWSQAGTTCDGTIPITYRSALDFVDLSAGTVTPGAVYLYKLTALAATGDAGVKTITWTAPNAAVMRILSATVSGNTVTLKFRYEPPATNASALPDERFHVTSEYGLDQIVLSGTACSSVAGCTATVSGVPSGSHVFTASAYWGARNAPPLAKLGADTTVIVP